MADNHNFRIKNGLEVGGVEVITENGVMLLPSTSTAATQDGGTNNTRIATTAFVQQEITSLIGGAPGSLNTLNELAEAINDDASYASTLTTALATKSPLASPTFTGTLISPTIKVGDGTDGRFFSDTAGRTAFADGDFYIQTSVNNCYIYATNTYLGNSSGDTIRFRGNVVTANNWGITAAGVITATGGNSGQWNTAYGWGNHAGLYLGATAKAADSNLFDGVDSTLFQRYRGDIGSGVDLNTYTTMGIYHQNSNSQAGAGSNYPVDYAGMLTVTADGSMVYQTYQTYANHATYERKKYQSTWESWHLVYDSGVFTNNSSNWNTAYTVANAALPKAGGTMTGDIVMNSSIQLGANHRILGGTTHRALEANTGGTQLQLGEGYGLINLFKTQNAVNELKLYNNRQDLSNVPVSKVSGYNGVESSNMTFYRGNGGSSGYIRFQTKPTNAASLTDQFQIGDSNTVGYGVNVPVGGYRINGTTVIDSSRNLDNIVSATIGNIELTGNGIGSQEAGLLFQPNSAYRCIHPTSMTTTSHTSDISLGWSNNKWKDIYLAGFVKADSGYQVGTTTVIDSNRNLTNIGTGAFSGKLTISNASYANHLELVRGSETQYITPSGGQLLTDGGLSPATNNTFDLGRSDKYWQDLWLSNSLKMGGTTVIDGSRNLTNIGTISNTGKHSSSIGSNATYSRPLLEITSSGTPTQIKITTSIPYTGTTHAHSVTIRGFQYGSANTVDLQISWHVYQNSFYNRTATSSGSWTPTITLAVENNKVVIHLAGPGYWPKMYVESMYNAYGGASQAESWSWSDAAISADANTPNQTVLYKSTFGNGISMSSSGLIAGRVSATEYDLPSSGKLDWANGDARIQEGLVNNYSLSFQTYDGSNLTTALRLDGNNLATFAGSINVAGDGFFNGTKLEGDSKEIIRYNDSWLRLNPADEFSSGIYCGSGILRTDGNFQVGSSGAYFNVTSAGVVSSGSITSTGKVQGNSLKAHVGTDDGSQLNLFADSSGHCFIAGHTLSFNTGSNSARTTKLLINSSGNATFSGNISHQGLTPTAGTDIDQIYTAAKTLTITTSFADTGIDAGDLATGTYLVQLQCNDHAVGGAYSMIYSGTMSWANNNTNDTAVDEIVLHRAGHASVGKNLFLRVRYTVSADVNNLKLQIRGNYAATGSSTYTFKFRRMI